MVDKTNGTGAYDETAPTGVDQATTTLEMRALEAEATVLLARLNFMRQAGISFKGARDLYEVLGYDREITTEQYRERYERGGIAGTIVDCMVDAAWRGGMWLEEDEDPEVITPFEAAWEELEERLNLTTYMIRADRLSRLSDYAVMLVGTSLDGDLTIELPNGKPKNLIYLQPYSGAGGPTRNGRQQQTLSLAARARVETYEKDAKSPRYGQPATYSLLLDDGQWASNVHHSRIIHVAENCLDDDVFGRSVLKRVWNNLDDLDKLVGGGAEAFWLRANQGTHLNIDKDMALAPGEFADVVAKLKAQSELYKHQQTRWLQTRGVDVQTLGSDVANFSQNLDAVLKLVSGSSRIPTRILTGSEMGELASSQDRENFKDQVNGRQEQHIGPNLVRRVADRFIQYGYLPEPKEGPRKYKVKFAHIQTMTEQEKTTGAKDWATVNSTQGEVVFTDAEIREKWADKGPLTDEQRKEIADRTAEKVKQAQEAMAATQPASGAPPDKSGGKFPRAASEHDDELIRILADAIECGNQAVVNEIIGLKTAAQYKLASTQIQLPEKIAVDLLAYGLKIPDADLAADGRETDAHITVKYGLTPPVDPMLLSQVVVKHGPYTPLLSKMGPITVTLGKVTYFEAPEYDVVVIEVISQDLVDLNRAISAKMDVAPSSHGEYKPHATVAYVKSGVGSRYAGDATFDGMTFTVGSLMLTDVDGTRVEVGLG